MRSSKRQRPSDPAPWYCDGLRFECSRCGQCCGGGPGYVWMSEEDIRRISRYLNMPEQELVSRHCRQVLFRTSLQERPNGDCVFLTPAGCSVYAARPTQCRTFPFWDHVLASRGRWDALGARCPGIGQGRLYSLPEIEAIREGLRGT